ncbi:hypothetical protein [Pelagicoccus sp. SDUM812003]|uniref:hypothetical protein n=1 Tax=Pelagicoccus sp. SDUM812003 TaxID=3041267 RepID=UPI00280F6EA5|nr:hypothetical protein [Pelagicoccus sp. SDUM812003]MDQ8204160.1 hypothetical protein [Pelagicoccus sp. SDUM812003]
MNASPTPDYTNTPAEPLVPSPSTLWANPTKSRPRIQMPTTANGQTNGKKSDLPLCIGPLGGKRYASLGSRPESMRERSFTLNQRNRSVD